MKHIKTPKRLQPIVRPYSEAFPPVGLARAKAPPLPKTLSSDQIQPEQMVGSTKIGQARRLEQSELWPKGADVSEEKQI